MRALALVALLVGCSSPVIVVLPPDQPDASASDTGQADTGELPDTTADTAADTAPPVDSAEADTMEVGPDTSVDPGADATPDTPCTPDPLACGGSTCGTAQDGCGKAVDCGTCKASGGTCVRPSATTSTKGTCGCGTSAKTCKPVSADPGWIYRCADGWAPTSVDCLVVTASSGGVTEWCCPKP